jgi:hypothetical protein
MRRASRRTARRVATICVLGALLFALLLALPTPKSAERVPRTVARRVALVSFVVIAGALVVAERTLKERREEEEADRILREELERDERNL